MINQENFVDFIINKNGWLFVQNKIKEIEKSLNEQSLNYHEQNELRKKLGFYSGLFSSYLEYLDIYLNILKIENEIKDLEDDELVSLYNEEKKDFLEKLSLVKKEINEKIYPPSEDNKKSVFIEIRAGTGGQEASLFARDLLRMYQLYGQMKNWSFSISNLSETEIGGVREAIIHLQGKGVYEHLRYESGVHRVQRIPKTETGGRVHTSTATVAVLPEADEVDIKIDSSDLRIDTYRASGAGGQHVNKTDSAVRITHIPTGTVVACQDERSQHKNRARAMKILQSRILASEKEKKQKEVSSMRKKMVASAERSDKVRTYNYPQNRVSDHQINLTLAKLEYIMEGYMNDLINPLLEKGKEEREIHGLFVDLIENYKI